jgi:hypothetical protein
MIDSATHEPIELISDEIAGASITVSVAHLEQLRKLLDDNAIPYWLDHHHISVNGGPLMTWVHLRKGKSDPNRVRALIDAAT